LNQVKMRSSPKVTVIVDTFNHARFIEQALTSVLAQGFSEAELEILVVDDGSTDLTVELIEKFGRRVQILRKENGGQASAFNTAIPLAKGEIVAFLDGDDWWAKNKLSRVVDVFDNHADIGVVGHGFYEIDEITRKSIAVLPDASRHLALRTLKDGIEFRNAMSFLGTSRLSIRRSVLRAIGVIPNTLVVEADEFISTMAVVTSGAWLIQEPLTYYRLHAGNLYQFQDSDTVKVQRKMSVLLELGAALRRDLSRDHLSDLAIEAIVEPIEVEAKRIKLSVVGGKSWETFQVERASIRLAYRELGWRYATFKMLVLASTLLLPPKVFYKIRDYYAKRKLRHLRRFTGEPVPIANIVYSRANNAKQ
jgi:glycosyltransferase involved in cell wall biosynthesis